MGRFGSGPAGLRGGPRPNSGRPSNRKGNGGQIDKSSASKYERLLITHNERIKTYGLVVPEGLEQLTPLDTMMYLMKCAVANGEADKMFALECARNCAPYLHPRLSMAMISHSSETQRPENFTDEQLQNLIFEAKTVLSDRNAGDAILVRGIHGNPRMAHLGGTPAEPAPEVYSIADDKDAPE